MQFANITSAADYVKTMALGIKWNERKADPTKAKGNEEDPRIAEIKRQAEQQRRANKLNGIQSKLKSGTKLSQTEMEYLRKHHPEECKKAEQIEKERAEYKRELGRCRSKEEVQELNQRKLGQFMSEAKAISNNPNIPMEKKLEKLEFINMRMMAVQNEHSTFVTKPEYQELPDTREEADGEHKKRRVEKRKDEQDPFQYIRTFDQQELEQPLDGGNVSDIDVSNEIDLPTEETVPAEAVAAADAAPAPATNPAGIYSPSGSVAAEFSPTLSVTA